jgi:hypothetical protein
MAEVVTIGVARSREMYDEVTKALGGAVPAGMILHTATEVDDGIKIIDVWESRAAADAFGDQVIGPVMKRLMGDAADRDPRPEFLEPFDVMRG